MPKIYDNIIHHFTKGLNETLELSERTDFCVGYFNLRGWKEVADKIDKLAGQHITEGKDTVLRTCRLLVGMQKMPVEILRDYFSKDKDYLLDQAEALKLKRKLAQEFKDQLTIGIPNNADEAALRKLSQQLKDKKVVVKLHLRYTLHAKLYLAYSNDKRVPVVGFLGSSNLTFAGLAQQGELNIDVLDQDTANKLATWFDDRWKDRWCLDITDELIDIIDNSWAADRLIPPFYIYLKIAYHLSREARAGISEFKLPKIFQKELLEFQQKAVLVAAHHLNKRGGVLIGDVVGLGKTIVATALAKMFEDDFALETLIICPKNLVDMWEGYVHKYHLRARVISVSKVQTILPKLRRYRLVVIDESHNLRNEQGKRYKTIKSYLEVNESKVILLSATPYNKTYLDLSNQLRLFIADDKDLGISPENYIHHIGGQIQFAAQHTDTFVRSIKAFEKSPFSDDWQELMRLYMVRRTRSFIKKNYAQTDPTNNRKYLTFADGSRSYFPDRIPKKVEYTFDPNDPNDQYAKLYSKKIIDIINDLELPRYGLQQYINPKTKTKPTEIEITIIQNLSRAGKRLMGFCRTNLFKRLESSGFSFLLSLSRHILRNYLFVYAIENNLPIPIGKTLSEDIDDYLEDQDLEGDEKENNQLKIILKEETYLKNAEALYNDFASDDFKHRFSWIRSVFFAAQLKEDLIQDSKKIIQILTIGKDWNPAQDRQLNALYQLITKTHPKEKILIFTQFADTVHYLKHYLQEKGKIEKLEIQKIESVTGKDENPTLKAHRFSPISNDKPEINKEKQDLRILITTDVLSEGQNLQDAHIILNYDLPWAIIRLIQRAGRVDRIGQKAPQIICYSFLPEDGIEKIISLRGRLTQRIAQNASVVGSDETFFEGDAINLTDLYSEKSGILDGENDDDTDIDLSSLAYQIWKNATDINPQLNTIIPNLPNVAYATKQNTDQPHKEGVIVYTRTTDENDVLAWLDNNGKVITQSQHTILKAAQCIPNTTSKDKINNHHELVEAGIHFIKEEEKNTHGTLGKKTGIKYKTYTILNSFCIDNPLFVTDELKRAIDDIYKYPLKEFAREILNRQLKAGIQNKDLALLVTSLREDERLAITNQDENQNNETQIICSMGLTNN